MSTVQTTTSTYDPADFFEWFRQLPEAREYFHTFLMSMPPLPREPKPFGFTDEDIVELAGEFSVPISCERSSLIAFARQLISFKIQQIIRAQTTPRQHFDTWDWHKAQAIVNGDEEQHGYDDSEGIHGALATFNDDPTGDNEVRVVQAVADAIRRLSRDRMPDEHLPAPHEATTFSIAYARGWNDYRRTLLDMCFEVRLEHPCKISGTTFGKGVSVGTVLKAAQRNYDYHEEPEVEAERIARCNRITEELFKKPPTSGNEVLEVSREKDDPERKVVVWFSEPLSDAEVRGIKSILNDPSPF